MYYRIPKLCLEKIMQPLSDAFRKIKQSLFGTPQWALEKIREAKEKKLDQLDLSGFFVDERLAKLPYEIFELSWLTSLDLSGNLLSTIPESITQLQDLRDLDLRDNQFSAVPESISQLQKLTYLDLSFNQLSTIPESITRLKGLRDLDLKKNQLSALPESIGQLQNLIYLDLSSNQLTKLPESITQLQNLTSLGWINNQLSAVPESISQLQNLTYLDLMNNELNTVPESISQLQNLTTLNLRGNKLRTLPEPISQLQNLNSLKLGSNRLRTLPESIGQLQNLKFLELKHNELSFLPESITQLQSLTFLDLGYNEFSTFPESISQLQNLISLGLDGNPLISPPIEIARHGLESIREYFRQLNQEGVDYLYEAKLLILGEGGAGKTTFAKKIKDSNYVLRDEETTKGVDVIKWSFPMEVGKEFKVNIWDFGGQEIYHATHQFFLTKRSLYVLVSDTRKEDTDFYYWLSVAELLSDSSPLLIVNNEKQERKKEINERQLKGQFNNIKDVLDVNLATNSGLDKVRNEIEHYLKSLPHIGSPLPKTWVRVRQALEGDKRNYISQDEYLSLCKQNGFADTKDSLQLSGYLNDIGVILHFQDEPLLRKTVILKPKWGTDAVYQVLDESRIIVNKGRFSHADLELIWDEPEYENMRDELLQLMMKFKLCYEIPNQKGNYIAPQLLSEKQPDYEWDGNENLFLQYKYEFMPKGILLQFIVAMSDDIWNQTVWKSGVVLEDGGGRAEVIEYYGKRQVHLRVSGVNKKALMTIVIHELDKIHKVYKQLKYDKMIPCNCEKCKAREIPHFYALERLQQRLADNRYDVECDISYKRVSIRSLIDDIIEPEIIRDKHSANVVLNIYGDYYNQGDNKMTNIKQTIKDSTIHGSVVAAESIKDSFNTIEKADIKDDLKEQLKLLTQAVEAMLKELPKEQAEEVADDMKKLAEEAVKEKPNKKWYSVSVDGLVTAAQNVGKVGEAVIDAAGKVKSILTGGLL